MPLFPGKENVGRNVKTEIVAGKPRKQAVAIALSVARKGTMKKGKKVNKIDKMVQQRLDNKYKK